MNTGALPAPPAGPLLLGATGPSCVGVFVGCMWLNHHRKRSEEVREGLLSEGKCRTCGDLTGRLGTSSLHYSQAKVAW